MKIYWLLTLLLFIGCTKKETPNTTNIKGVWGLSGISLNEENAKKKFKDEKIVEERFRLKDGFKNILKENYKILEIDDSISFYHRKQSSINYNYKDSKSYVFDYSANYEVIKKSNKYYLTIYDNGDTVDLEIFEFSSKSLMIEARYGYGLNIDEFKRIE